MRGQRFGTLTVLDRGPNDGQSAAWNCRCDCGREHCRGQLLVRGSNLKTGNTSSCGSPRYDDAEHVDSQKARYAKHQRTWRKRHPSRVNDWRKANPDKVRSMHLKKKFGLTIEQWDLIFAAQGRRCAGCGSESPGASGKKNNWATDHDHTTGRVRGIICIRCNFALGWLGDTLETVMKHSASLIAYLSQQPLTLPSAVPIVEAMSHRP